MAGGAEYDCVHPRGSDDRNLVLIFPDAVPLPATALLPVTREIASMRRDLHRHLGTAPIGRDGDELDAIGWSLVAACHRAARPDRSPQPGPRARRLAAYGVAPSSFRASG